MLVFGLAALALHVVIFFGPPPPSDKAAAVMALGAYAVLAGLVARVERRRPLPASSVPGPQALPSH
jgi:hypothetical protein